MIRLFVPDALQSGAVVRPSADQAHYLVGVMRRGAGDEVLLFNGRDGEWRAALTAVSKRGCELAAVERTREQTCGPDLELIIALVKRARLETIVEKAAELGAARVQLITTRFTNADHINVQRLQAIAVEASEQTGRLDAPQVLAPVKLEALLDGWGERPLMFCDEAGDAKPVADALSRFPPPRAGEVARRVSAVTEGASGADTHPLSHRPAGPLTAPPRAGEQDNAPAFSILIGPEGGFSPEERGRLRALPFVVPVNLGPRILRADTAAISALTLWQATIGDWRQPTP